MMKQRWVLAVMLIGVLTVAAVGDTIVMKSGKELNGKIIQETDTHVIFEVQAPGVTLTMQLKREDIRSITKGPVKKVVEKPGDPNKPKREKVLPFGEVPEEPKAPAITKTEGYTYVVIPMKETVGREISAEILGRSLKDAAKRKPTVVILEVDSPGGYIMEVSKIRKVLKEQGQRTRIVVYVTGRATSAAAILSLATKEIYMRKGTTIGAAVAYTAGIFGYQTLDAKFQSIWRADARLCAEQGGHSPLFAEAMVDNRVSLYVVDEDGQKVLREGKRPASLKTALAINTSGQVLNMTAPQAVQAGLAVAVAETYAELGKRMGYPGWKEIDAHGRVLDKHWQEVVKKIEGDYKKVRESYDSNFRQAVDNDPDADTYRGDRRGRLTAASKRRREKLSKTCARFLMRAEKDLEKIEGLAKKYPQLLNEDPDMLRNLRKRISEIRKRIFRDRRRREL